MMLKPDSVLICGRPFTHVEFALEIMERDYGAGWTPQTVTQARKSRKGPQEYREPATKYGVDPQRLYSIVEVGQFTGHSPKTVARRLRKGLLRKIKVGRATRIQGSEIISYIDASAEKQ